jgi:nicotinamidase-related amidase
VRDALVLIDAIQSFEHQDGQALLASFRARLPGMRRVLAQARAQGTPVIYVNDRGQRWDSDAPKLLRTAIQQSPGGDLIAQIAPVEGDSFILKQRYSGFDHTPLALLLQELGTERLLLAGAATEGCVIQTGIDARELGYKVTIVPEACATNDEQLEQLALAYAQQVAGIHTTPTAQPARLAT